MVDTLSRADRTLEGRWWRRDVGGKMVRFVVCRKGDRHVVAARDGDMLVLQRVAPQVGLAGMVNDGARARRPPADVEPLTGVASKLAECDDGESAGAVRHRARLGAYRTPRSSPTPPAGWRSPPNERHPGGTYTQADVAAGVLDSRQGRIVSIPRRVNGELYGSFLPGTTENLQRALDGLIEFLPVRHVVRPRPTQTPTPTRTEKGIAMVDDTPPARCRRRARRSGCAGLLRARRRVATRSTTSTRSDDVRRADGRRSGRRTAGAAVHRDQSAGHRDRDDVHGRPRQPDRPVAEGDHDDRNAISPTRSSSSRAWPPRTPGPRSTPSCSRACASRATTTSPPATSSTRDLDLPSPEEAEAARAQVFATRYAR